MKHFIKIFLSSILMWAPVNAADVTAKERLQDGSQLISREYRDVGDSEYAPTFHSVSAFDWDNIAAGSTTTIKTSGGILHKVCINTVAAVAFTVYNSTHSAGTSDPIAAFAASSAIGCYEYNIKVSDGIQLNCAGSGPNITIVYK